MAGSLSATSIRGEPVRVRDRRHLRLQPGALWSPKASAGTWSPRSGWTPALLLVSWFVARGSLRGRLAATGLLGYVCYQYLMYAMFWAIGPLFPAFVLLYPLALWGIVG